MEQMEQYIKLAPAIAMINVTKIDSEQHYSCQVIPSTASSSKISKPYQVRRKYEDFELLNKSISAVLASKRYSIESGTILLNGATVAYLPKFPEKSDTISTVQGLDSYMKHLLLLPKEILKLLPLDKFFGHWIQDKFESKAVLSDSLANKIGAMISMGYDTSDDVLANILKRDQDLKSSPTSQSENIEAEITKPADFRRKSRNSRTGSFQRPSSQLSQSQTIADYAEDESELDSHSSSRASEIPTYEEFVAKLANSLSVDINEAATPEDMRDTIADNPLASSIKAVPGNRKSSLLNSRMSIQSVDTVLASPVPLRGHKYDRSSVQIQEQELRKTFNERLSLPPRSSSSLSRMHNEIDLEDTEEVEKEEEENKSPKLDDSLLEQTISESSSRDTIINAPQSPIIPVRKDVSKNDLRLRTELVKSDLVRKSPRSNSTDSENINPTQKSASKAVSSVNSSSSNTAISPVTIPSRKESKNWNINSPEGPRSSSPLARRVNKDHVVTPKTHKLPLDVSREENISTLLRATARRSPDVQSLHSLDSASSYASRQPTPLSLVNHFTVKLIQTSGDPIAIKVADAINFEGLISKISLVVGHMSKMRVCYRDVDYELITITDDESWELCKETINEEDKLTLFLVKKVVLNAMNM